MTSLRTFATFFILFCSVIHSAMAYGVYYGSWYIYVWIPFVIIAIIRCCCYFNQKGREEPRVVYVEGGPGQQTVIPASQVQAGRVGVVVSPVSQPAPPYDYGKQQGGTVNTGFTPGPGTAYPPQGYPASAEGYPTNAPGTAYPPQGYLASAEGYPTNAPGTAYPPPAAVPPPPQYSEAVKLPVDSGAAPPQ